MARPTLSASERSVASLHPPADTQPKQNHARDLFEVSVEDGLDVEPSYHQEGGQSSDATSSAAAMHNPAPDTSIDLTARSNALQRWSMAVGFITEANQVNRYIKILQNKHAKPADRFFAAVNLCNYLHRGGTDISHEMLLHYHLTKRRLQHFSGMWDRLDTELYVLGSQIFELLTPAAVGQHWIVFTLTMFFVEWLTFFFMAGQYPYYELRQATRHCVAASAAGEAGAPAICSAVHWPVQADNWHGILQWIGKRGEPYDFSFSFLREWGGRYGPDIADGEPLRWVTSSFVHANFMHALANMLLFTLLASHVEHKYGTARTTAIYFVTVLGANFLSTALEDPCLQVVGASGGIFGIFGLYMADMMVNFESIQQPFMRSVCAVAFLAFFLYTAFTEKYVSHISHIGGLTCGLLCSFLILPQLKRRAKWEWGMVGLGVACLLGVFMILPIWLYKVRLQDLRQYCEQ